ncbi:MAG TPA: hypothetical protein VFV58_11490, partial [Blastocatellia bacterium]|nr:hypothetical protein [Blastocatellia bacterium]
FHWRRDPGFVTGFAHQETIGLRRLFVLAQSGRKQLNICQRVNIQETKGTKVFLFFFVPFVSS